MKLVSFDPGGTTGVCTFIGPNNFLFHQMDQDQHHLLLYQFLLNQRPDKIIYEKFTSQPRKKHVDLRAREYIGVIKLYGQTHETEYVGQDASTAKQFWTDDKLKVIDLYIAGSRHAMDALRHMLYYLTFEKGNQTWLKMLR